MEYLSASIFVRGPPLLPLRPKTFSIVYISTCNMLCVPRCWLLARVPCPRGPVAVDDILYRLSSRRFLVPIG